LVKAAGSINTVTSAGVVPELGAIKSHGTFPEFVAVAVKLKGVTLSVLEITISRMMGEHPAVVPVAPDVPVAPVAPDVPVAPVAPDAPVAPNVPVAPVAPVAPEVPVAPVAPEVPVAPEEPTHVSVPKPSGRLMLSNGLLLITAITGMVITP
jgi:hypothetical protein